MICSNCKQKINQRPCPHCGCENVIIEAGAKDGIVLPDSTDISVVSSSSLVTVEREGQSITKEYPPGTPNSVIVNSSWQEGGLEKYVPAYIQEQVAENIRGIERYSRESDEEVTEEHSFEINFGVFKYRYTRKTKK